MEPKPHYLPTDQIEAEGSLIKAARDATAYEQLDPFDLSLFALLITTGVIKIYLLPEDEKRDKPYQISNAASREENCFINLEICPDIIPEDQECDTQSLTNAVKDTISLYRQLRLLGAKFEVDF